MPLLLKEKEVCQFSATCPYNNQQGQNFCAGASSDRGGIFVCDLVTDGIFTEGKFRSKFDQTGKMKVILENGK